MARPCSDQIWEIPIPLLAMPSHSRSLPVAMPGYPGYQGDLRSEGEGGTAGIDECAEKESGGRGGLDPRKRGGVCI